MKVEKRAGTGQVRELLHSLTLQQRMRLAVGRGRALEASQAVAARFFDGTIHLTQENLVSSILRIAKESSSAFRQSLLGDQEAKGLLGASFGEYVEEETRGNELAVKLVLALKMSPELLFPYTQGRRDIPDEEYPVIIQKAASELAAKLNIPSKYLEELKDKLLPGLTDPDHLELY